MFVDFENKSANILEYHDRTLFTILEGSLKILEYDSKNFQQSRSQDFSQSSIVMGILYVLQYL